MLPWEQPPTSARPIFRTIWVPLPSTSTRRTDPTRFRSGIWASVVQIFGGRISPTQIQLSNDKTAGPDPTNPTSGTGDAFASFMAGAGTNIPGDSYSGFTGFNAFPASQYYLHGGYIQDDWKIEPEVHVEPGIPL